MAFEFKPGQFSLFKNDKKTADNQPNYTGQGKDLQGNDIYVSAWLKDSTKGKFMSCSFQLKDKSSKPAPKKDESAWDDSSDSIPF